MKKIISILIGIAVYSICAVLFMGYGHTETHPFLNEVIVKKFLDNVITNAFTKKDKFKNYEFTWSNDKQQTLVGMECGGDALTYSGMPADKVAYYTPMEWITQAGWWEDEPWGPASLCHFYDPMAIDGATSITDCSGLLESFPVLKQIKDYASIDALTWATTDSRHPYTWIIGKKAIVNALKEPIAELRNRHMALAYRCLGQTLHLVADMGCPPHVRNDSHPPNIAYVIGDPDPYEDICKSKLLDVNTLSKANSPNKYLLNEFNKTENFEFIFDKLAKYTNGAFYSGGTINTDRYKPKVRPDNPYPSPLMTEANYVESEYTYYENYDGVTVMMCKDKVPVPFPLLMGKSITRGRPYLDFDCVKSMASALYPNIAEAGANVIRLFVPSLKMNITEAKLDSGGIIRGNVSYYLPSTDDEYYGLFDVLNSNIYNGPVTLFINGKDTKIIAEAKKNKFVFKLDGKIPNLKKDDLAVAKLEFGGIVLKSEEKKVGNSFEYITSFTHNVKNLTLGFRKATIDFQYTLSGGPFRLAYPTTDRSTAIKYPKATSVSNTNNYNLKLTVSNLRETSNNDSDWDPVNSHIVIKNCWYEITEKKDVNGTWSNSELGPIINGAGPTFNLPLPANVSLSKNFAFSYWVSVGFEWVDIKGNVHTESNIIFDIAFLPE